MKHLAAVADALWCHCCVLVLCGLARHIRKQELARVLLAGAEVVRDPGTGQDVQ